MISKKELKAILANKDPQFIEDLARQARDLTIRHFGKTISLYAPLYLSNFCENRCIYCGFQSEFRIKRKKLNLEEMNLEMATLAATEIQNILLLTGESRTMTPLDYLISAVGTAKKYFPNISLEVYPLETDEYKELFKCGVDGVTIYQETYHKKRYRELHQGGKKADFQYRYQTPERIARAGMRSISMGVLLGLAPIAADVYELYRHLSELEKNFPGVEFSLSFPRLIPLGQSREKYHAVSDLTLVKLICLTRILFPRVGINLSTRESREFRDRAIHLGVTRISAASKTTVGGYKNEECRTPQFQVQDNRSVPEIVHMLEKSSYDPVFTDWRRIESLK